MRDGEQHIEHAQTFCVTNLASVLLKAEHLGIQIPEEGCVTGSVKVSILASALSVIAVFRF